MYLLLIHCTYMPQSFDTATAAVVTGQCSIATGQGTVGGGMAGLTGSQTNTKEEVHVRRLSDMKVEVEMISFINIGILKQIFVY